MRVKKINKNILVEQKSNDKDPKPLVDKLVVNKANLRNIIEVTEQNQPNTLPAFKETRKQDQGEPYQEGENCIKRCLRCIRHICTSLFTKSIDLEIETKDGNFAQIIQEIKNRKMDYVGLLPPPKGNKKVLVLDLDETLIHTTFTKPTKYDFQSEVLFNGKNTKIYTVKRFGLDSFLFEMSKLYQIIIFTASQKLYADRIIDQIDPKRRISHRLYRQHCFIINKTYFLKNVRTIGRNIKDVIIVDDNNVAGLLQPQNFYKIQPFQGNEKDRQLLRLSSFLKYLHEKQQFTSIKQEWKQFQSLQIDMSSQVDCSSIKSSISQGKSLVQRKRGYYSHKKRNSQIENLVTKSTEDDNEAEESATDFVRKV